MNTLNTAILKTLNYSDIFDFPLTSLELHKYLIEKKCDEKQLEKSLKALINSRKIFESDGYYFVSKPGIVSRRKNKILVSEKYTHKTMQFVTPLAKIPWVEFVCISGSLARQNASIEDDIDLFFGVKTGKIWLCRFLITLYLTLIGERRFRYQTKTNVSGKFCTNLIIDSDGWLFDENLYNAYEIAQCHVIWQRGSCFDQFLLKNRWINKYLPNFKLPKTIYKLPEKNTKTEDSKLVNFMEYLAKVGQLYIMGKPKGQEKIFDHQLFFHPFDYRKSVLKKYFKRIKNL